MGLAEELQDETAEVLSSLIRFKTVNPPGGERACIEWLAGYLEDAGLTVEVAGAEPDRPCLVATLEGGEGPSLGYLSHVDTVLADPQDWSADPWGAEIRDGFMYGRGTIDMKNQTAAEAVAAARLARSGAGFAGTLKVIAVPDEETGGELGAKWITEQRPDLSKVDYLLNEGAGAVMPFGDRRLFGVCVAEKGTFRFNVRTSGTAAHASVPGLAQNALLALAPLITRLGSGRPGYDLTEASQAVLEALGDGAEDPGAALERVRTVSPPLAALADAMMSVTFAPTIVSAGEKINVIPARAQVRVDCRVPPGMGEDVALKRVREVLGDDGYELEFTEAIVGNRSPVESKLMDAIHDWVVTAEPGAETLPLILPAFTDSRWFRAAFPDCIAYGFFPQRHQTVYETWPLMHSHDERIDVRDLGFAAAFYHDLPGRLLARS
ncbi:M20/M25/M40 family metallo-hydrolase [Solirubrobacter sp. CPCC 204708]|uniref:M20/M25/M40 family metallo-hydrolase n=1 Tax=Solirubrobacter deserti TaxID=2282478 RepID=A0ABT4RBU3_9ACTN|nr:M20/M25/M40 family metallo-hydrolase [Solirubrobacter deserti]MBE2317103.1 M20/M25/M40 family metallo-hydrolase [Solirubrobacter deserti]MDA0136005.1 M20/M25/M40 family metallo-hydrolase [Solirubrobacter deserti]